VTYLEEDVGAADVTLSEDVLRAIDEIVPSGGAAAGERYPESLMAAVER
jgi:aryl-alcohol dehydrogenase-like predicted oxidoreductase